MKIDKYAYISNLKSVNGQTKIIFSMVTLIMCIWANHNITSCCIIFTMLYMCVCVGKIPLGYYLKLLFMPIMFLFLSVIGIVVNVSTSEVSHVYVKIAMLYFYITENGINQAVLLCLKALGSVSCLYFMILTTPMPEIISFLKGLKVNDFIIEQLTLVYRFIFILLEIATVKTKVAQTRFGNGQIKLSFKTMGMIVGSIFVQSYQHAITIYNAMLSRGYQGKWKTLSSNIPYNKWNLLKIAGFELFMVILTVGL